MRFSLLPILLFGLVMGAFLGASSEAEAQVLVYRLEVEPEGSSINFSFYDSGYLILPATGGTGSFVFTNTTGQRTFVEAADSVRLFLATKGSSRGEPRKRAVVSAMAVNGSAEAFYLMLGALDERIDAVVNGFEVSVKVADSLEGNLLAADSEEGLEALSDGSLGFAGMGEMRAFLQRERTNRANAAGESVATATASVVEFLENQGFENEAGGGTDGGDGGGGTDGGGDGGTVVDGGDDDLDAGGDEPSGVLFP